jgi:cell division protein FtsL
MSLQVYTLTDMRDLLAKNRTKLSKNEFRIMNAALHHDRVPGFEKERADLYPFFLFQIHHNGGNVALSGKTLPPQAIEFIKFSKNEDGMKQYNWYMNQLTVQMRNNLNTIMSKRTQPSTPTLTITQHGGFDLLEVVEVGKTLFASFSNPFVAYQYANVSKDILQLCVLTVSKVSDYLHQNTMYFIILCAIYMLGTFFLQNKSLTNEGAKLEIERSKLAMEFYQTQYKQSESAIVYQRPRRRLQSRASRS